MPDEADRIAERNEAWRRGLAQEHGANGADEADIAKLRKRVGGDRARQISLIAQAVAEATRPLIAAIKKLHTRIEELERQPRLEYCGIWAAGNVYGKGNVVTHHGSCWHANRPETTDEPGKSDSFTLMVKRGKDAK